MKWRTKNTAPVSKTLKATFYHPQEQELVEAYKERCAAVDGENVRHMILPVVLGADFWNAMYPVDPKKDFPYLKFIETGASTALELSDQLYITELAATTPMGRAIKIDWEEERTTSNKCDTTAIILPSLVLSVVEVVL